MIWCLGMFSSASTWTFNVVQKVASCLMPTETLTTSFLDLNDAFPDHDETSETLVVKTHGTVIARELGRRAKAIVISIRDPRDAVASLMNHNNVPFDVALRMTEISAWTCARFVSHRKALLLKFEERFFEDPGTVERIAGMFPGALHKSDSRRIFEELRRDAVDRFISELETLPTTESHFHAVTGRHDTYDVATGWHKHHAGRTAEVGRWRHELSELHASTINRCMRPWMERFGYHPATPRRKPYVLSVGRFEVLDDTAAHR